MSIFSHIAFLLLFLDNIDVYSKYIGWVVIYVETSLLVVFVILFEVFDAWFLCV